MSQSWYMHRYVRRILSVRENEVAGIKTAKQFLLFAYLQAISCIFPVIIFFSLALSGMIQFGLPRYDVLLIVMIAVQVFLYYSKIETRDELLVITMFHALGILLEWHKVQIGSWSYPENGFTKIWGVPLYAGFMYASVGSYICQAWRNLRLSVLNWPRPWVCVACGVLIYGNFFTNSFMTDIRIYIAIVLVVVFARSKFRFELNGKHYDMPAILSFFLVGFFI